MRKEHCVDEGIGGSTSDYNVNVIEIRIYPHGDVTDYKLC